MEKHVVGAATVLAVFGSGNKRVAGCKVEDGKLKKDAVIEVTRGREVVHSSEITELRRVKDIVDEVRERGARKRKRKLKLDDDVQLVQEKKRMTAIPIEPPFWSPPAPSAAALSRATWAGRRATASRCST